MSTYGITFVDDDALTDGLDFAFVDIPDGGWIFYRESNLSPTSLEDSWAAYRALLASRAPDPDDGASEPIPERLVVMELHPRRRRAQRALHVWAAGWS